MRRKANPRAFRDRFERGTRLVIRRGMNLIQSTSSSASGTSGASRLSRRDFLRKGGALAAGSLAVGWTAGCTPVRMLLRSHPAVLDHEIGKTDRVLLAFVDTVAPAEAPARARSIEPFGNDAYHFARYREFFAGDLCRRSKSRLGSEDFDLLVARDRERVIEGALEADSITRRLYQGAIYLAHLSVYGGIVDGEDGTPAIRFDGSNEGFEHDALTYPNPESWLPLPTTKDGNPA